MNYVHVNSGIVNKYRKLTSDPYVCCNSLCMFTFFVIILHFCDSINIDHCMLRLYVFIAVQIAQVAQSVLFEWVW